VDLCEVVSVARNALARQTTLFTPDSEEHAVDVVEAESTVREMLQDWPPKVMAKEAVPAVAGVPVIV
jgi:hypothetical protein